MPSVFVCVAGQVYELPPAMAARRRPSKEEPLEDFVEAVGRVPTQQLKKALVAVYQGLSPMLATVMASRVSGLKVTTKVGDISPEQWSALYSGPWKRWIDVIGDGGAATGAARGPSVAAEAGAAGEVLPIGDDGDASAAAASAAASSSTRSSSDASVVSAVPPKPWISEDGASYYPTTLGEEDEHEKEENETGVALDGAGIEDGASASGGGGGGGWGRRMEGLTKLEKVMEAYYRGTQSSEEFSNLKRRCLARVTSTLAKLRQRAAEFEDQLAAAQEDKVGLLPLLKK